MEPPKYSSLINIILFLGILTFFGLATTFSEKKLNSDKEKRALATLPEFSLEDYFYNGYTDSIDRYVGDHFFMRDTFIALATWINQYRGFQSQELGEYDMTFNVEADEDIVNIDDEKNINRDSLMKNEGNVNDVQNLGKVLFYQGRAIQRFGGRHRNKYGEWSTDFNAGTLNLYHKTFKNQARIFSVITPTAGEIHLPTAYKHPNRMECNNIKMMQDSMHADILKPDICLELHKHKGEYLYFATDHHWTGRAAYYAYRAFCKSAGFEPIPMDSMERKVIPGFLGTLYHRTRDERLKANIDSVEYFKVPNQHRAYVMKGKNYNKKDSKAWVYSPYAGGANAYGIFLGRDYPMMCIDTDIDNGKTALITKNSYGNPFATYLVAHYSRVIVIDYRKFKGNIADVCKKNKVDDIIIFQNSFSSNTGSHGNKLRKMLTGGTTCFKIERDTSLFKPK